MTLGRAQPANAAGRGGRAPTEYLQTYAGIPKGQPPLWRRSGGSASRAGTEPLELTSRPAGFVLVRLHGQPAARTHPRPVTAYQNVRREGLRHAGCRQTTGSRPFCGGALRASDAPLEAAPPEPGLSLWTSPPGQLALDFSLPRSAYGSTHQPGVAEHGGERRVRPLSGASGLQRGRRETKGKPRRWKHVQEEMFEPALSDLSAWSVGPSSPGGPAPASTACDQRRWPELGRGWEDAHRGHAGGRAEGTGLERRDPEPRLRAHRPRDRGREAVGVRRGAALRR
jgi:hypothetical protein